MRRLLAFLLKAAISAVLLYLALHRVNFDSIGERLGKLDWVWIFFLILMLCVQVALTALRWREIVTVCGAALSVVTSLRYSLIGQFFSQVLPSTVGGDAVRIWLLARGGGGWPVAIYSVLIDRVVGVSALAALVLVCMPWTFNLVHDPLARAGLLLIGFGAMTAALIFLMLGLRHFQIMDKWWPTRHLAIASRLAWRLFENVAGVRVVALSFTIHLMTVGAAWCAAMSAHASVDFTHALFLVLPVILIATVPISIAGWGLRESAMILAFSYAGLAENDGLIISILFGFATLATGAIGGIAWITGGYRWCSVKTIEAETHSHGPAHDELPVGSSSSRQ